MLFNNGIASKSQLWDTVFGSAECVNNYYFYMYEYIDECAFMQDAEAMFEGWPPAGELLKAVYKELEEHGCSGGGKFEIMWLPSFVGANTSNHYGHYLLHYKQDQDGVSWLVSPCILPFHRLFQWDDTETRRPRTKDKLTE